MNQEKRKAYVKSLLELSPYMPKILYNHCIQEGGKNTELSHLRMIMDCIQICQTSADFMTHNSKL